MNDETLAPGHPIKIVIVGPAQAEILDVAGPFEVFVTAANFYRAVHPGEQRLYDVALTSDYRRARMMSLSTSGVAAMRRRCGKRSPSR